MISIQHIYSAASICFEVICCFVLSKISSSAVNTLTAVIMRRELGLPLEPDNKIPRGLKGYIEWGNSFKKTDESRYIPDFFKISKYTKFGNRWYTYGNHILFHKNFNEVKILIGGRIAIVKKFRTKTRKCIVFYSDSQLIGPDSYFFGVF